MNWGNSIPNLTTAHCIFLQMGLVPPTTNLGFVEVFPILLMGVTPQKTNKSPEINGWKMYFLLN